MTQSAQRSWIITALEYGPIIGFIVAYAILRNEVFTVMGRPYTGIVAVTALFLPIFVLATAALWWLTGRLTRIQIMTSALLILFGGLSIWLNDPTLIKMKPTVIYLILGLTLGLGLLLRRSWVQFVMEDMIPLSDEGWRILTKRLMVFCFAAAAANEAVWRTQTETIWLGFETVVMPMIVVVFFLAQVPLFVRFASLGKGA